MQEARALKNLSQLFIMVLRSGLFCLGLGISFSPMAGALYVATGGPNSVESGVISAASISPIHVGAEQFDTYLPLLSGKRVALVVNQSALVTNGDLLLNGDIDNDSAGSHASNSPETSTQHLLDALLSRNINVVSIMSPEHGFRGDRDAGEKIDSNTDSRTGLPIHSLYGKTKKPSPAILEDVDTIIFDIQDVGVRFYTYLSTLHYVIEAAFEQGIDVIVLDRPNPNIAYVDGPMLTPPFKSFIGMHPIPVLHGMTLGELAKMIVGEGWVEEGWVDTHKRAKLTVIPVANYTRAASYSLPIAPSPNLPNDHAIRLYPTLCFFEGTSVSIGRGTDLPFQLIGHPIAKLGNSRIKVAANRGASNPKHKGKTLFAQTLVPNPYVSELSDPNSSAEVELKAEEIMALSPRMTESKLNDEQVEKSVVENLILNSINGLHIQTLIDTFKTVKLADETFFTRPNFFDKLAGSSALREAIMAGKNANEIRALWQADIMKFKEQRAPYLIYPERTQQVQK